MSEDVKYILKVSLYLEVVWHKYTHEFTEHAKPKSILPPPCLLFASGVFQQQGYYNNIYGIRLRGGRAYFRPSISYYRSPQTELQPF